MHSLPTYDNVTWELIASSLQHNLTPEEALLFRQWLDEQPENRVQYDRLQQMWNAGLTDYIHYRAADEEKGWEALQQRLRGARIIQAFPSRRTQVPGRWLAAAAVMLVVVSGLWYISRQHSALVYATVGEQKKMSLPDGSQMVIGPRSRVRIAGDFNKTDRTIILESGKAQFAVAHQAQLPFTVDVDVASIKDIGTSFTVEKNTDSILVTVSSGKVAFVQKATGESQEISSGNSLMFYPAEHRFGPVRPTLGYSDSLRFRNAPLSAVAATLQQIFGGKITLEDPALGQKRLTADLNGLSLTDAVTIICTSLDLEYKANSGDILFKRKDIPALTP